MIAINPLQERGLERFTAPQNPFEMLTNSETQLASAYYNVRIGGDMALLKGMMRLLIERDDAASAAGRPSLLDDEFIQTHTVGFDELRRDVLNSEWKDIERISGLVRHKSPNWLTHMPLPNAPLSVTEWGSLSTNMVPRTYSNWSICC